MNHTCTIHTYLGSDSNLPQQIIEAREQAARRLTSSNPPSPQLSPVARDRSRTRGNSMYESAASPPGTLTEAVNEPTRASAGQPQPTNNSGSQQEIKYSNTSNVSTSSLRNASSLLSSSSSASPDNSDPALNSHKHVIMPTSSSLPPKRPNPPKPPGGRSNSVSDNNNNISLHEFDSDNIHSYPGGPGEANFMSDALPTPVTDLEGMKLLKKVVKEGGRYSSLQDNDLELLLEVTSFLKMYEGNTLIKQGDSASFLAIVLDGSVSVNIKGMACLYTNV